MLVQSLVCETPVKVTMFETTAGAVPRFQMRMGRGPPVFPFCIGGKMS
jgi:hypothetical protein